MPDFYYDDKNFIHYDTYGEGTTNLILIHGFASASDTFTYIIPLLQKHFKIFVMDLKGAGVSSKPKDEFYSIIDHKEILVKFIRSLKLKNVILAGHSLGGAVSILIYDELKEEKIINKIILIDAAVYLHKLDLSVKIIKAPIIRSIIAYLVPNRLKAHFALKYIFMRKKVPEEKIAKFAEIMKSPGSYYALLKSADLLVPLVVNNTVPRLKEIEIPVLIIWGKNDPVFRVSDSVKLNEIIKESKLVLINECGHLPHIENPEKVSEAILDFTF